MWLVETRQAGASFGAAGKSFVIAPTETFPIPASAFEEIPYPSGLAPIDARVSAVDYNGRRYRVGAWSDNVLTTEWSALVRQGIQAPTVVPSVALSAGPGITAAVICYLAYFDILTGERSSLSAPAPTLNAVNQKITWSSLPTAPLDTRITHIELWRSVDGSLPRLVMQRQLGVTSVVEAVALGDLGETFVESFERFPRCKYNTVYHDRQIMAGDDEHPDTLYLSLLFQPERWGGLTLRTRNGEPIIGLLVVRDRLIVQCPFAMYTVDGYTEDDLSMQIFQPHIGSLGHATNQSFHGLAFIWTHLGAYLTDGSGVFPLSEDVETKFREQYQEHRQDYENAFSVHDPVSHVVKLYVGAHDDIPPGEQVYWGFDYTTVIPQEGGSYGQPSWFYDVRAREDRCAVPLALPGGRRAEVFTGSCDGFLRRENFTDYAFTPAQNDDGDSVSKRHEIRHGANFLGDYGGDAMHGKRFTECDVFLESEENQWTFDVYGGGEKAFEASFAGNTTEPDGAFHKVVAASKNATGAPLSFNYEKLGTHFFKMPRCVGRAYTLRIQATSPKYMEYRGHQIYWKEGPAPRVAVVFNEDPG